MIREIYFRDPTDSRYNGKLLEENKEKEILLSKIRMILYTERGEILGSPELGLDLENNLFEQNIPLDFIRNRFYTQLVKYVPETQNFKIDIEFDVVFQNNQKIVNIYININNKRELGLVLN